jgi:hypothetical protein
VGVNKSDPGLAPAAVVDARLAANAAASPASPTAYGSNALAGLAAVTAHYGMALHAYEGGPDTSGGSGAGALRALAEANLDARMADVVAGIFSNWQSWGGGGFNYFIIGAQPLEQPWGSYATRYDLRAGTPTTPKEAGLARVAGSPPAPVAAGWPVPVANHSASLYVGYYAKNGVPPADPDVSWLPPGTVLPYLVRLDAPCAKGLNVSVLMSNFAPSGGADALGVSVGAFLPGVNVTAPSTGGSKAAFKYAPPALFPPLPAAALPSGLVAVRLSVVTPVAPRFVLRALDVACRTD